jgi:REP element-mobilizing transposase RayT
MSNPVGARASSPHKGWHERGYLPHFDGGAVVQTITFRLADSIPGTIYEAIAKERLSKVERWSRFENVIDGGRGSCVLAKPQHASKVRDALYRFDGTKYRLLSWVIMPNHVHVMVEQHEGFPHGGIVHSWKSFTSNAINKTENRTGKLWAADYFDRYIRDDDHYRNASAYIENNPVKAKLVSSAEFWPYSSAFRDMS